jgi:proteic killer suppression protein
MIKSFRGKAAEKVLIGRAPKGFPPDVLVRALRKLKQIDDAADLNCLLVPPGNNMETLKGDRAGQHSIRINSQWRICFEWRDGDAWNVEIVDYH